ncbi:MAG: GatB/YqeY domain-containing protein [Bacteroidales bacterium]|nr:GatB/YqeY domain-containing protein [Bacteroidales bacterium]MBO7180166.1 GatB/YqeY domain-containing protein [Bacteroidales bacterium]MBO7228343.1 GatB/YqeY domain-containing protein [Bacteroidales bacterium]MBQ2303654.1 GatB/YqeY domain-containing protein [Bacteroidales bacterium]MBQ2386806.1 GatB/YqeY domain-containing protein [Bacteroidales bacterium]
MTLEERINADIKAAMLAKERKKLDALRAVKSAILLLKTNGSGDAISEEAEIACLQKLVKQRKESAELYKQQNRMDLYEDEAFQQAVIEAYLPEQMSEEEIRTELQKIISETGASSVKDMGKVMGAAQKAFAGRADNKVVSTIVKELLG